MEISITGKKMDIGDTLRTHTQEKIQDICKKYDISPLETSVIYSMEGSPYHHLIRCDIEMHLSHDVYVRAHGETDDAHVSLDETIDTFETRLRRHKEKVIDHIRHRD